MKKIFILFTMFLSSVTLLSQTFDITWQNCFGGSENDWAMDIVESNSGYLVVGATNSSDGDISFNHGMGEGWLISLDTLGNLLWERCYGGSDGEMFDKILPNDDSTYYILGRSGSSDGDISYDPYPNSGDFWILKIDEAGNIIWDRIVGTTHYDHVFTGITTDDGGVIAIGWAGINDGDKSVWYGYYDMWMIKLNSEGETQWDFTLGGSDFDFPHAIIQTSDGGYLVGGTAIVEPGGNLECDMHDQADALLVKLDSARNIEWQHCYGGSDYDGATRLLELDDGYIFSGYVQSNDGDISGWHGAHDIWVVKIDFYGNIIWQKCLGGSNDEFVKKIFKTADDGLLVFGNTSSNNGDVYGNHSITDEDNDIWVIKLNSEGEIQWQQCIGGTRNENLDFGVIQKDDSHYVIAGRTDNATDDVQCELHGFNDDFWVFEIKDCSLYMPAIPHQPSGPDTLCTTTDSISTYTINPAAGAWSYEWLLTPSEAGTLNSDSTLALLHWAANWEGQVEIRVRSWNDCGNSEWSEAHNSWAYSCLGLGDMQQAKPAFVLFPNPAQSEIHCRLSIVGDRLSMYIYDLFGRKQYEIQIPKGQKQVKIDVSDFSPGIYFAVLRNEKEVLGRKKFVVR